MDMNILNKAIVDFDELSVGAKNALIKNNIVILKELVETYHAGSLLSLKSMGKKKFEECEKLVLTLGYKPFQPQKYVRVVRKDSNIDFSLYSAKTVSTISHLKYKSELLSFLNDPKEISIKSKAYEELMNSLINFISNDCDEVLEKDFETASSLIEPFFSMVFEKVTQIPISLSNDNVHYLKMDTFNYLIECVQNNTEPNITDLLYKSDLITNAFYYFIKERFKENPIHPKSLNTLASHFDSKYNTIVERAINRLIRENEIYETQNGYTISLHWFREIVHHLPNEDESTIIERRLNGESLESIGNSLNLTRERVRQIQERALNTISNMNYYKFETRFYYEDNFYSIFNKYYFQDEKEFFAITGQPKTTFYYLSLVSKKGKLNLPEGVNDLELPRAIRTKIYHYYKDKFIIDSNKIITLTTYNLKQYLVEKYCKEPTTTERFEEIYNEYLYLNKIDDPSFIFNKRTFENHIAIDNHSIFSGKTFRYYAYEQYDFNELIEHIDLLRYDGFILSTKKFIKDFPLLMKQYDIQNEYELHNLLKKILSDNPNYQKVEFGRMPHIKIGSTDINKYITKRLLELSPISFDDFVSFIENETGIASQTIKANYLNCISQYLSCKKYEIPFETIPDVAILPLKEAMIDEYYTDEEFEQLFKTYLPKYNEKFISSYLISQLGYNQLSGHIGRKNSSMDSYILKKVSNVAITDLSYIYKRFSYSSSFMNSYYNLLSSHKMYEIGPRMILNNEEALSLGIDEKFISNYYDLVKNISSNKRVFSIKSLEANGFIINSPLTPYFYDKLLQTNNNVSAIRTESSSFFSYDKTIKTLRDVLLVIVKEIQSISINNLIKYLDEEYGYNVTRTRLIEIINSIDVYYDREEDMVYPSLVI